MDTCERCEFSFGDVRDDGAVVIAADQKWFTVDVAGLCNDCAVARDNAAEQAFVDHEMDKFFGGGR